MRKQIFSYQIQRQFHKVDRQTEHKAGIMDNERYSMVTVTMEAFSKAPFTAAVTLRRPFCRCWPGFTRSQRVAFYVFEDGNKGSDTYKTLASSINTKLLERHRDDLMAQVKIVVKGHDGEMMKVLIDLDTFIRDLSTIGFVQVDRKLILSLLPTESEELQMQEQDHLEPDNEETQREDMAPSLDSDNLPYTITNNAHVSYNALTSEDSLRRMSSSVSEENKKKRRRKGRRRRKRSKNSTVDPSWLPKHMQNVT